MVMEVGRKRNQSNLLEELRIIGFTQYTDPILLAIHFSIAAIQSLWRVCLVGVKCPYHLGKHDMVWDSDLMVVARSGWQYTDIRW